MQRDERAIIKNKTDYVCIRKKRYGIKWLKNYTRSRISDVVLANGNDDKQSCMVAALMTLNGFWAIKFLYGIRWRWFYYIRQYGEEELTDLIETGKKKVPADAYFTNTILAIGLKDTSMTMKKTEVATFLQGQNMEQLLKSPKNTVG